VATFGSSSFGFDIIPLVSDFSVERNDPLLPCRIMPPYPRNRAFFGRSEVLDLIKERLLTRVDEGDGDDGDDGPNLHMFAICGPGGIGKTQVATEFVHRFKDSYDAIFWVQADEHSKLSQGYTNIASTLGLVLEDSADARDPVIVQDLVKGWLANPVKTYKQVEKKPELATWLLIFDNVDDPDILDDFWPFDYADAGAVLITSRDPLAKKYMYSEDDPGVILAPFTIEEATEFLLRLTRREDEEVEKVSGKAVAERLGGLPLALTQMAGVIERRDLSFSEFLRIFEEEDVRSKFFKMQVGTSKTRNRYQHTLDTVWALEKLNESSAILLDVLSLLDPDGIPELILEGFLSQVDVESYPRTEAAYQEARTELLRSSLIARNRAANRIAIHRLVQDGARTKMTDERFELVFSLASRLLFLAWPFEKFGFGHRVSRWAKCADLFPHVIQLHGFSSRLKTAQIVTEASIQFPRLLTDAGR
jgi:NB-ARC domain